MLRKDGAEHAERVYSSVRWNDAPYKESENDNRLLRSWERSLDDYRLDPGRTAQPRILTAASLKDHIEPLESFLRIAKHGVRTLYEQVAEANYVVLLTDGDGVTIDFIGNARHDRELKKSGLYLGSVWTESEEGTCGVGTAIIDRKPILVHKREHFRAPNTTLTCSSAPIFDVDGGLLGILDASALYSPDDRKSQTLVLKFVTLAADMIENAHFLNRFRHGWVLQLSRSQEFLQVQTDNLIAFDESGAILAMNRRAQQELPGALKNKIAKIEDLFEVRAEQLIRAGGNNQQAVALQMTHFARRYFARVRMPETNATQLAVKRQRPQSPPRAIDLSPAARADNTSVGERTTERLNHSPANNVARHKTKLLAPDKTGADTARAPLGKSTRSEHPPVGELDERGRIIAALRAHKWQVHATARALGMSRATIYRKMSKYAIVSPNKTETV